MACDSCGDATQSESEWERRKQLSEMMYDNYFCCSSCGNVLPHSEWPDSVTVKCTLGTNSSKNETSDTVPTGPTGPTGPTI